MRINRRFWLVLALLTVAGATRAQAVLTVVHPAEGQQMPPIREVFVFGEVTPGSSLTINGTMVRVHPKGGYLVMVPVQPGPVLLVCVSTAPTGEVTTLERRFTVSPGFVP